MELRIDNEPMDEPEDMDEAMTEGLGLMAAVEKYREFVPDVHFELIPIKDLVSNQQYQRKLSLRHVDNAAAEFNRAGFGERSRDALPSARGAFPEWLPALNLLCRPR